jgi:hypothetical protein
MGKRAAVKGTERCNLEARGSRLGSWGIPRTQVPPDAIDKVRGMEIVFSAEEPSSLIGKTIDVTNRKFFVRD